MPRYKQPTALAKIKGTYQPCRYETGMDEALDFIYQNIPAPPEHFTKEAKAHWINILTQGSRIQGYISKVDLNLFAILCKLHSEIIETEESIDYTFKEDKSGVERINPRLKYLETLRRQYFELSKEFGLSPASRSKIKLQELPTANTSEDFIL